MRLLGFLIDLILPVILEKKWEYNDTVHQLFVDFKKAYDSVRREVLYSILIEFGVPMNLVRLIKMCLNETYSKVRTGKHLSDNFLIQNGLGDNIDTIKKNTQTLIDTSKEIGLEVNTEKIKYMLLSRHQNAGQYQYRT
jgi:hypothetical protein